MGAMSIGMNGMNDWMDGWMDEMIPEILGM